MRLTLERALVKAGYSVDTASDGAEALEHISPETSAVLLDVIMPGMDGFETCRRIKTQQPETPVIMLTASDDLQAVEKAFLVGADDFVNKPINLPLLLQRIRYAIRDSQREAELIAANFEQETACNVAQLTFWSVETHSLTVSWSKNASTVLGYKKLPTSLYQFYRLLGKFQAQKILNSVKAAITHKNKFDFEVTLNTEKSSKYFRVVGHGGIDSKRLLGALQDVTQIHSVNEHIKFLSEHDQLTGLPQRRLFERLLDHSINSLTSEYIQILAAVRLTKLHEINTVFNKHIGDELIIGMTQHLKNHMPSDGILCKLDAGRFLLAFKSEKNVDHKLLLKQLLQPMNQIFSLSKGQIMNEVCVGFMPIEYGINDVSELIDNVITTERFNSETGTSFEPYRKNMKVKNYKDMVLELELHRAFEYNEFVLHYQPQLCLDSGEYCAAEALVRWQHSKLGILYPDKFIPQLESMGKIVQLGDWVLAEAMRQLAIWQLQGNDMKIAVNVAAKQFESGNLVSKIRKLVELTGCNVKQLELEVTETMAMKNTEATMQQMHELKELGITIAIDDFGTGYSSMEYLLDFPCDIIKIDKRFSLGDEGNIKSAAIIKSIVAFCNAIGIRSLLEGVETADQLKQTKNLGVDIAQGFYLSKPLDLDALNKFLAMENQDI
ncbi:MAG: EAL domain-containing protein [Methylophaga sp.]|nr:EAL domain-containing protein [Methylophaga sp.]